MLLLAAIRLPSLVFIFAALSQLCHTNSPLRIVLTAKASTTLSSCLTCCLSKPFQLTEHMYFSINSHFLLVVKETLKGQDIAL